MPQRNGTAIRSQPNHVTLDEFLEGQRKINGRLCRVDQKIVTAITELRNAINGAGLSIDFTSVDEALQQASYWSQAIPGVNPPGCEYPN